MFILPKLLKIVLLIIGIFIIIFVSFKYSKAQAQNYSNCNFCGIKIPEGHVLKITTIKTTDPDTLERWVKDFIENNNVVKIDRSKFPKQISIYYIEKKKNIEK